MSIHQLPCEILRNVFENSAPQDVPKLRQVCQMFNSVIKRNYIFLPRIAYIVKIFTAENGEIMISHRKSGDLHGSTQNVFEFDFNYWKEIGIVELELVELNSLENAHAVNAMALIFEQFIATKQVQLRNVVFTEVHFDEKCENLIQQFVSHAMKFVENIVVEKSHLPITIDPKITASKFDHFRWINSTSTNPIPTDAILAKIHNDMKTAVNKRNFLLEMDAVHVNAVCDFIEEWLRLPIASFFNLSFHNCDELWKSRFLGECERRKITHHYMEFQSKAHANAHIKVSFSQDGRTCCLWPILDVPARSTGQSVCFSRYFRDF